MADWWIDESPPVGPKVSALELIDDLMVTHHMWGYETVVARVGDRYFHASGMNANLLMRNIEIQIEIFLDSFIQAARELDDALQPYEPYQMEYGPQKKTKRGSYVRQHRVDSTSVRGMRKDSRRASRIQPRAHRR